VADSVKSILTLVLFSSLNLKNYGEMLLDDSGGFNWINSAVDSFT
jgi:hypothetical protein